MALFVKPGRSLKTTNCFENVNSILEERCEKVDHRKNSNQRHRWTAAALLDIEPRIRAVFGLNHLRALRVALKNELNTKEITETLKSAA